MIDAWINALYHFLNSLGYSHPIHPALVHMPIGLVIGAFAFAWIALLFRKQPLARSARHCIVLALFFWFPVVLFGLMDWQHWLKGAWLFPIKMKLILAGILFLLLMIAFFFGRRRREGSRSLLIIYTLCFFTVIGLGYFGGQLVYAGKGQAASEKYKVGGQIFQAQCSGCHPSGGNVINPQMPLINAPKLKDPKSFIGYIRNPTPPMPVFSPSQISDRQAHELYGYIVNVLEKQKDLEQ
jgi:uncharacterized membrane protein